MKTHWITTCIVTATLALAPLALAKDKEGGAPAIKGHVTAVDAKANTITLTAGKKAATPGPQTFTVTSSTAIKIDGSSASLADIKPKMNATVSVDADGKTAKKILIKSPKAAGGAEGGAGAAAKAPTAAE
jgi:hypothetical protein